MSPPPSPVRSEISKTSTGWNTVHRPWTRDPAAPPGGHPHRRGGHGPGRDLDPPLGGGCGLYPGGEAQLRWDLDLQSVSRALPGGLGRFSHRLVSGHSGDGRPGDGGAGADGPSLNPDPHTAQRPGEAPLLRGAVPIPACRSHSSTAMIFTWSAEKPAVWLTTSTIRAVSASVRPPSGAATARLRAFSPMKATQSV